MNEAKMTFSARLKRLLGQVWHSVNQPLFVAAFTTVIVAGVGKAYSDAQSTIQMKARARTEAIPYLVELEFRWNALNSAINSNDNSREHSSIQHADRHPETRWQRAKAILNGKQGYVSDPRFTGIHAGALVSRLDAITGIYTAKLSKDGTPTSRLASGLIWLTESDDRPATDWRGYILILGRYVKFRTLALQGGALPIATGDKIDPIHFEYLNLRIYKYPEFSSR